MSTRTADVKYAVPVALHVVDRPRLYDLLDLGAESPVTLLSASAGWGKTVLVGSWLAARAVERPAWLTVGPGDDTPRAFWRAVATSLAAVVGAPADAAPAPRRRRPGVRRGPGRPRGRRRAPRRRTGRPRARRRPPGHLARGVGRAATADHGPAPRGCAWWCSPAATRRGRCTGCGSPGCSPRCAPPTWPSCRTRPGSCSPSSASSSPPTSSTSCVQRTDGWAAGLRLAALPLRAPGVDVAGFLASFSGDDRTVTAYLLSEVLAPQSEPVLRFLEKICILDVVCAELADAVTGDEDGAAMLAELSSSNLFVQSVGDNGRWFRLHGVRVRRPAQPDGRAAGAPRPAPTGRGVVPAPVPARGGDPARPRRRPAPAGRRARRHPRRRARAAGPGPGARHDARRRAPATRCSPTPSSRPGSRRARMVYGHDEELADLIGAAEARLDALPAPRARRVRLVLDLIALADARLRGDLDGLAAACRRIPLDPGELAELGLAGWDLVRVLHAQQPGHRGAVAGRARRRRGPPARRDGGGARGRGRAAPAQRPGAAGPAGVRTGTPDVGADRGPRGRRPGDRRPGRRRPSRWRRRTWPWPGPTSTAGSSPRRTRGCGGPTRSRPRRPNRTSS